MTMFEEFLLLYATLHFVGSKAIILSIMVRSGDSGQSW